MKVCSTCKVEKELSEFNKKSSNRDGLERYCRVCHKARNRSHYQNNSDVYKKRAKEYKQDLVEWFKGIKQTLECVRCGEDKPWRLSFHHTDPKSKDANVSDMVTNHTARAAILAEIEKCIVVCHNCHSDIHYGL